MRIRHLNDCPEIIAGDFTRLRELLHPDRNYPFCGRYSFAHAIVDVGQASTRHRLKSGEVYYILAGQGTMHVDGDSAPVGPGDVVEIPPGSVQWIENVGPDDLAFLCIVDPAWRAEDEEILEDPLSRPRKP
ncbi:MAG: cupin domain-containing protein [candidate division Zixibacteria bacterium]|nr:cupin domain-containing protein [candidate division Zixibacteria bacterium]